MPCPALACTHRTSCWSSRGADAMRTILIGLLFIPTLAAAEPIEPLKPMEFLAGHCWKGAFADARQTDEHCFDWLYAGQALRDTHTVRAPGRADYVGETTYYWNSATRQVE